MPILTGWAENECTLNGRHEDLGPHLLDHNAVMSDIDVSDGAGLTSATHLELNPVHVLAEQLCARREKKSASVVRFETYDEGLSPHNPSRARLSPMYVRTKSFQKKKKA